MRIPSAPCGSRVLLLSLLAILPVLAAPSVHGQVRCAHQGSEPRSLEVQTGPRLSCAGAPHWPAWHYMLPAHRAVVPKPGFHQGEARAFPCVILQWRCTGWLLVPVAPLAVRTLGYVLDVAETPCIPPRPVIP